MNKYFSMFFISRIKGIYKLTCQDWYCDQR